MREKVLAFVRTTVENYRKAYALHSRYPTEGLTGLFTKVREQQLENLVLWEAILTAVEESSLTGTATAEQKLPASLYDRPDYALGTLVASHVKMIDSLVEAYLRNCGADPKKHQLVIQTNRETNATHYWVEVRDD